LLELEQLAQLLVLELDLFEARVVDRQCVDARLELLVLVRSVVRSRAVAKTLLIWRPRSLNTERSGRDPMA
jgi:hypothetical protein